ncbi:MAG: NAD-dependent epimerase/dehydratase family protein [Candidatus Aminicenantes bacterium]|nr:MAG: NAD-dependent epimerase/dehydratase family protein [Candidatus Aminicenantes bacterium]
METVLVTGGAGYVGSPLISYLLDTGYRVVVIDKLSFGGESLVHVWGRKNFAFIRGDICSPDFLSQVFDRYPIDHVVHLAAIVGDPACEKQPELARKVNYEASLMLLDIAIDRKIDRFIFASTCSNYGKMSDPDRYVDESSPLAPVSLYAELKVHVEDVILNRLARNGKFCPVCLRFSTVYGISPRMRFDLTVNEFTKDLSLGRELLVYGEQFWRPYCHVQDFSRAIRLALTSAEDKVAFNVYNVGSTAENYRKSMIIEEIEKLIPNAKVRYVAKEEDPRDYRVSFEKIASDLGFNISKRVPDGIREIKKLIDDRVLKDPDESRYRNI